MMDDLEPHEAGYMKPPKEHRFKPGRSGNPRGRPKRIDDPYTTLQKVLARRIAVKGQAKKMTIREALIRRLRDRALAGSRRAIALQQKILGIASATQPPDSRAADTTAAKLRLVRMLGLEVGEETDASDAA